MAILLEWLRRLRGVLRPSRTDADLQEELRLHLALANDEAQRRGEASTGASPPTRLHTGSIAQAMESLRDQRGVPWLSDLWRDVRSAWRTLGRAPGFTAVAILSLALGIGANVVIFSVVDAALLRPLPYRDADRLVEVLRIGQTPDGDRVRVKANGRNLDNLRAIGQVFEGVDAYSDATSRALATEFNSSVRVGAFTPSLPGFLGVAPQLGRGFATDDVTAGDRVIISDAYWRRAYGGDPEVIGATLTFPDRTYVIVGVMPPTFRYFVGARTDAWLPTTGQGAGQVVGRLRPGLTAAQAQREIDAVLASPDATWKPLGVEILPADWNRTGGYFGLGQASARTMLFSLLGAVALVLAIGCANVANLLLSRTLLRQREIAVRRALGATRMRVARQFLVEALLLAAIGSGAAAALAWWSLRVLPAVVPANLIYSVLGVVPPQMDTRVLAFGCLMALLTGVLCGIAPAIRVFHLDAAGGLMASDARMTGPSRLQKRASQVLQALQVAMTVVLLAGAGLLMTSLFRMVSVPAGFDARGLGYADLTMPAHDVMGPVERRVFFDQVIARLGSVPDLQGITAGVAPVEGFRRGGQFMTVPDSMSAAGSARISTYYVRPDYFRLVGIPIIAGRPFGPEDTPGAPPVAIVSETTARRYWPGRSAIGRQFREFAEEPLQTVVGVAGDIRTTDLMTDGVHVYQPSAQHYEPATLVFRASGDMARIIPALRATVLAVDSRVVVTRVGSVDHLFMEQAPFVSTRFYTVFLGLFAAIGVMTAAVGLYGLLSYSVSRRTREIGVRIALGASRARLCWVTLVEALGPLAIGLATGVAAALWLSQFIASQLFQVAPTDPTTLGLVVALLLAVSASAAVVPVRRATRVDPTVALRME